MTTTAHVARTRAIPMPSQVVETDQRTTLQVTVLIGAGLFALTQFIAFVHAFIELNQNPSRTIGSAGWLVDVILAGAVTVVLVVWVLVMRRVPLWPQAIALGAGLVVGNLLARQLMNSIGPGGHGLWTPREGLVLVALLAPIVAFVVFYAQGRHELAWNCAAGAAVVHAVAYITAAAIFLVFLEPLAVESERINPVTPAGGFFAALVGLLAALWGTRRRARVE